ncbi:MAG: branched-chain amino acid ABC transporter permease [Pseudomonadota bacterium]
MAGLRHVAPGLWVLLGLLILFPAVASDFFVLQIGAYSMILGVLALSLMWLAGYGGMVSLAQVAVAGLGAYMLPILGTNTQDVMGLGWPWWLTVLAALTVSVVFAGFIGAVAARTEGIYTLMITLAFSVVVFYFARQNYTLFNGFTGFAGIDAPTLLGVYMRDPVPFYYLVLAISVGLFALVTYASRSTFGLSLQAVRDNPRRLRALGYNVTAHRVFAFAFSGFIAGIGGILLVWFNGRIAPSSISIDITIDILVIAVVGGLRLPIGPFIGAVAFVLLDNFAIDLINRERFNTVIGIVFLLVVYFSPDGLLGLWDQAKSKTRLSTTRRKTSDTAAEPAE